MLSAVLKIYHFTVWNKRSDSRGAWVAQLVRSSQIPPTQDLVQPLAWGSSVL